MSEQQVETPTPNPWWGIWVQPRKTIRRIIETDPKMNFWVLVVFYGVIRAISWGIQTGVGDYYSPAEVAGFILFGGPLIGITGVYLTGALLRMVGRLLGGAADGQHVRTVLAWAAVPMNVLVIMALFPFLMMFGQRVFSVQDPQVQRVMFGGGSIAGILGGGLTLWRMMLEIAGSFYYIAIVIIGISEVEKFGVWKSTGIIFIVVGGLLLFSLCLALAGTIA